MAGYWRAEAPGRETMAATSVKQSAYMRSGLEHSPVVPVYQGNKMSPGLNVPRGHFSPVEGLDRNVPVWDKMSPNNALAEKRRFILNSVKQMATYVFKGCTSNFKTSEAYHAAFTRWVVFWTPCGFGPPGPNPLAFLEPLSRNWTPSEKVVFKPFKTFKNFASANKLHYESTNVVLHFSWQFE